MVKIKTLGKKRINKRGKTCKNTRRMKGGVETLQFPIAELKSLQTNGIVTRNITDGSVTFVKISTLLIKITSKIYTAGQTRTDNNNERTDEITSIECYTIIGDISSILNPMNSSKPLDEPVIKLQVKDKKSFNKSLF